MKSTIPLVILFFVISTQISFTHSKDFIHSVESGVIDLSMVDFSDEPVTRLDGDWEFYPGNFFNSRDFSEKSELSDKKLIHVPGNWNIDSELSPYGYGTLRIQITGLEPDSILSLYIPEMLCNYKLWIDGRLLSQNGKIGVTPDESRPQFLPKILSFYTEDGAVELIIHISNFHYRNNGIWRSLFIGSQKKILSMRELRIMLEVFLSAVLLSISLFHIGIFIYRRKEKTEFLFGLICLTFLIRIVCTGEQLLTYFIPQLPWEILRKMEYIPFYASAPLLTLFLSALFPYEYSKIFNKIYIGICLLWGAFVIVTPVRISNQTIAFAQLMMLAGIAYAMVIMIRAIKNRIENSILIMAAYLIFSLTVVNDILFSNQFLHTLYLSPLGFVIFIIMQSQMLTRKFTRSFSQRELLARSRDKFKHASITDGLTGLFNVRYLHQILEKEILETIETDKSLTVIMADVDNFKLYNDTWGHKQGDQILKKMADIIRKSARENDSPCRYGGEEFAVILPETNLEDAAEVAERIRIRFEMAEDLDERMLGITVSIGVAQYIRGENVDQLIERADKALYLAKDNGKNRVELA